jgi:LemA protein
MAKSKKRMPFWLIGAGVLVLVLFWLGGQYNNLVRLQTDVEQGWSEVQTQYQRRADLVPQLVSTVKGAADFEASTYQAVTEARTGWLNTQNSGASIEEQMAASNSFDSALSRLLVTVENYPDLKATENFLSLQTQLEGTENRVSVARDDYNSDVSVYNKRMRQVPTNFVAMIFSFDEETLFESAAGAENAPEVEFEF